jgi:7,8-dihydropterin-6-yl-methyl-4-(beta-D-ribofuranosyl)aminobenzene 5'-phosphate synthase
MTKITIVFDNTSALEGLRSGWGFSALVEAHGYRILFDTGADGHILLSNMARLNIDPSSVDEVFISHAHMDHTGGLWDFLAVRPVRVYVPESCPAPKGAADVVRVSAPVEIHEGIYSTGELAGIEQSMVVRTERGLLVIVGCSHPGVGEILRAASSFGEPFALVGGLHGFREFGLLEALDLVCPTHCTRYRSEIRRLYPEKYVPGGAGAVIEV